MAKRSKKPRALSSAPWERQRFETADKAWEAFCVYRDLGSDRSLRGVMAAGYGAGPVRRWSAENLWVERARAWDDHLDAIQREKVEGAMGSEAKQVAKRHLAIVRDMQSVAAAEVRKYLRAAQKPGFILKPHEISRMVDVAIKLERLVRGEATERIEGETDLSQLSVEELRQLKELQSKVRKG